MDIKPCSIFYIWALNNRRAIYNADLSDIPETIQSYILIHGLSGLIHNHLSGNGLHLHCTANECRQCKSDCGWHVVAHEWNKQRGHYYNE